MSILIRGDVRFKGVDGRATSSRAWCMELECVEGNVAWARMISCLYNFSFGCRHRKIDSNGHEHLPA